MTDINKSWIEAFETGIGCPDCGAPMMMIPNSELVTGGDPNTGVYQCILCTWVEDETNLLRAELNKFKKAFEHEREEKLTILDAGGAYINWLKISRNQFHEENVKMRTKIKKATDLVEDILENARGETFDVWSNTNWADPEEIAERIEEILKVLKEE